MFEKVNPSHPDKIADRIAGALVDYVYTIKENPHIAVEVLIGHGDCMIVAETDVTIPYKIADDIVRRIVGGPVCVRLTNTPQDEQLAQNQKFILKCGDNGIFKGVPITTQELRLSNIAKDIYTKFPTDGKYILDKNRLIICQSCAPRKELFEMYPTAEINPLGDWTGGINVDCGATNRKLGSDMGLSITGGGLHGKDLSKADVSVNIYAWILAQKLGLEVEFSCAIGDTMIAGVDYETIVGIARSFIKRIGGFEKFAEWGLINGDCMNLVCR